MTLLQVRAGGWGAGDRTLDSGSKGRRVASYTTPQGRDAPDAERNAATVDPSPRRARPASLRPGSGGVTPTLQVSRRGSPAPRQVTGRPRRDRTCHGPARPSSPRPVVTAPGRRPSVPSR